MKKFSTLIMVMLALIATQDIQARNNQTLQKVQMNDEDETSIRYATKQPDPDFKFEKAEITIDLAQDGPYELPKLLNPNKLEIEKYAVTDTELASVDEAGNFKIIAKHTGDVTLYAQGKRNAKFLDSEAECLIHIVNSSLVYSIMFGTEKSLNREGDGGWYDPQGYWAITQTSWWIAGEYNWNMTGYTESYLISPVFNLSEAKNYAIEFIHTCYYKEGFKQNNKLLAREVGGDWIEMEGIKFPEPQSYAEVASGRLKVPAELIGKKVEFAFKNIAEHSANDSNWNILALSLMKNVNTETSIDNIEAQPQIKDNKIYDLQGRMVKNPAKGIYIMNGKKVIFK